MTKKEICPYCGIELIYTCEISIDFVKYYNHNNCKGKEKYKKFQKTIEYRQYMINSWIEGNCMSIDNKEQIEYYLKTGKLFK